MFFSFNTFYILAPFNKKCKSITNFREGRDTFYHCDSISRDKAYSVDSIKHTVLLKVLLQIFLLVSIKSTVHWKFSRQKILRTVSIKHTVFIGVHT